MDVAANVEQHGDEIERVCPPGLDEGVKIQKVQITAGCFWRCVDSADSCGLLVNFSEDLAGKQE